MRLVILCEGDTEERVLKDFLQPYCTKFASVQVMSSGGASKLKGEFKDIAELTLQDDEEAIVICLIDLYEAPFLFPKWVRKSSDPLIAQYEHIKKYMEEKIAEPLRKRFFAFPVVMELETWLLADVDNLNTFCRTKTIKPYPAPETIEHPAKELKDLSRRYRKQGYSKVINGQELFKRIDAKTVYEDNCPHFELIINQLLRLQGIRTKTEPQYEIPNQKLFDRMKHLNDKRNQIYGEAEQHDDFTDAQIKEIKSIEQQMKHLQDQLNDT